MPTVLGDCHEGMKLAKKETIWSRCRLVSFQFLKMKSSSAQQHALWSGGLLGILRICRAFSASQAISGMIGINECRFTGAWTFWWGVKESGRVEGVRAGAGRVSGSQNPAYRGIIIDRGIAARLDRGGWQ